MRHPLLAIALLLLAACASQQAAPSPSSEPASTPAPVVDRTPTLNMTRLEALAGTRWTGTNELWLDPLGNTALTSDATMSIEENEITYTITFGDAVHWHDTFHMPGGTDCAPVAGAWGLWQGFFEWSMGGGPNWGWRIGLFEREGDALVMQMTVIKPSGEEGRAVRMTLTKQP